MAARRLLLQALFVLLGSVCANGWRVVDDRGTVLEGTGKARVVADGESASSFHHLGAPCAPDGGPGIAAVIRDIHTRVDARGYYKAVGQGSHQTDSNCITVDNWSRGGGEINVTAVQEKAGDADVLMFQAGFSELQNKEEIERAGYSVFIIDLSGAVVDYKGFNERDAFSHQQRLEEIFFGFGWEVDPAAWSWCEHFRETAKEFQDAMGDARMKGVTFGAMQIYTHDAIYWGRPVEQGHLKLMEHLGTPLIHINNEPTNGDHLSKPWSLDDWFKEENNDNFAFPRYPPDVLLHDSRGETWMPDTGTVLDIPEIDKLEAVNARQIAP